MLEIKQLPNSLSIFIKSLKKSKFRKEENLFLTEGKKLCAELFSSNFKTKFVVINKDEIDAEIEILINNFHKKNIQIYETKNSIFENLCDAISPQGIIAVAEQKKSQIISNTSFIALDNISDPGNVGTIIRTAEWFGIKQIVLVGNCANPYSPKVVRSSMGSIFRMNFIYCENTVDIFRENFNQIDIFAASLDANFDLKEIVASKEFGLIVGNETRGISSFFDKIITKKFLIKGFGKAESLNVAVATGVSLFQLKKLKLHY